LSLPRWRPWSLCCTQMTGTSASRAFSTRLATFATTASRSWASATTPFWTSMTRSAVFGRFSRVVIPWNVLRVALDEEHCGDRDGERDVAERDGEAARRRQAVRPVRELEDRAERAVRDPRVDRVLPARREHVEQRRDDEEERYEGRDPSCGVADDRAEREAEDAEEREVDGAADDGAQYAVRGQRGLEDVVLVEDRLARPERDQDGRQHERERDRS